MARNPKHIRRIKKTLAALDRRGIHTRLTRHGNNMVSIRLESFTIDLRKPANQNLRWK